MEIKEMNNNELVVKLEDRLESHKEDFLNKQGSMAQGIADYIHNALLEFSKGINLREDGSQIKEELQEITVKFSEFETNMNNHKELTWKEFKRIGDNFTGLNKSFCKYKENTDKFKKETKGTIDKLNTLRHTGRGKVLEKKYRNRIYKTTGLKPRTLEYKLFYPKLSAMIRDDELKESYNVGSYLDIPDSEFSNCLRMIEGWYPPKNWRSRFMREYQEEYDNLSIAPSRKVHFESYRDLHKGVI